MSDYGRDVPEMYQGIAARAGKSRSAAMKLFCLECVGYVRQDVTDCTATRCPLHSWRPYQKALTPHIPAAVPVQFRRAGTAGYGDSQT